MMSNARVTHDQRQTIDFLRVNIRMRFDAAIQKTLSIPKSKVIAFGDELAVLRNAQCFILEGLNLLGNCVLGEPSEVGEVILPTVQQVRRGARHMLAVVEINLALWGMLVCSGIEVSSWLQFAF
jgi:hypothetical protein